MSAAVQAEDLVPAALYARMSLDSTGEGLGIERQTALGRRLAEAREWDVVVDPEVTSDNSLSASGSVERPGFERLLNLIESGRIKAVVAYSFDRIARNQKDGVRFLELAKAKGVRVAFCQGGDLDLTTAMGQFVAEMMLSIAKLEIGIKGERQRAANRQRAERGIGWKSGPRLFGWLDESRHHPVEAAELGDAYDHVLAGGTLRSIASDWNARSLLGTSNKQSRWTSSKVRGVLLNPRNAGRLVQAGVDYGQPFEAIVVADTFEAVRAILTDPARRSGPGPRRLLSGFAQCPCGEAVSGTPNARGKPAYRHQPEPGDPHTSGHVCRASGPIDAYVTAVVLERLSRPDAAGLLAADLGQEGVDVAGLRQRKATLLVKAENVAAEWATAGDELSARQMRAATKAIGAELAGIDKTLTTFCSTSVLAPLVGADDIAGVWEAMGLDEQRAVIGELFTTITIYSSGKGRQKLDKATGWPVDLPRTVRFCWRTEPDMPVVPAEAITSRTRRPQAA